MKKYFTSLTALISVFILLFSTGSSAQNRIGWKGSGGWGMGTTYSKMYNPETLKTINGEVVSIDEITPLKGMSYGVHITVNTGQDIVPVHLGPGWFIENQDIKIEPKDLVEIKGSRITFEGKPAIIATEIRKGEVILKLRDENGSPVWSGWRRR